MAQVFANGPVQIFVGKNPVFIGWGDGMDEETWLNKDDFDAMIEYIKDKASDRKLRLIAVANARALQSENVKNVFFVYVDSEFAKCVDRAERWADSEPVCSSTGAARNYWISLEDPFKSASQSRIGNRLNATVVIRDIIGNPFHDCTWNIHRCGRCGQAGRWKCPEEIWPVTLCPNCNVEMKPRIDQWLSWSSGTVRKIAETIYQERALDLMGVLGDSLEDAGCDDAYILDHCRKQESHFKGCWLVDILTGRK